MVTNTIAPDIDSYWNSIAAAVPVYTPEEQLSARLLGPNAEEFVKLFALAIRRGVKARELAHTIYAYQTNGSDLAYMV